MEKKQLKLFKLKEEKGSITVFVVAAMFFMLVILGLSYMGITNKNQAQIKDIAKIKEEYEVSDDQLEKVYEEAIEKVSVGANFNANGGTYYIAKGGKVQISSTITIRESEGLKVTSAKYGWSTSELMPPSEWTTINGKEIAVFNPNCGEGKYYIWVSMEDSKGVKKSAKSEVFEVKTSGITFSKSPEDWTNENVEVTVNYGEGLTKNRKIGIGATPEEAKVIATTSTEGKVTVEEVSYVYAEAEDEYGNKTEETIYVDNIDKVPSKVQLSPNGGEYRLKGDTATIEVTITAQDGESGLKQIEYAWSTSRTLRPIGFQIIENGTTVTKEYGEGTYYLWVIAEDNVGNRWREVSLAYIVRTAPAPTVTLKENNIDGADYAGVWTNQNVYTQLTMPESEGNVQKYEISRDGVEWNEINEEGIDKTINYETAFPLSTDRKPDWFGELTDTVGTNYHMITEGTTLVPNNKGVNSTQADSYIPIDLTEYPTEDKLKITINASVSSENNWDWGYACVTDVDTKPTFNKSSTMAGEFFKKSGTVNDTEYTITIDGGKQHYLHIGYYKDSSGSSGKDQTVINSIKLESETIGIRLNFEDYTKTGNTVEYKLTEEMNEQFQVRAVYEDGTYSPSTTPFEIKIDKTVPVAVAKEDYISLEKANIIISNIIEAGSGVKGYYVSTEDIAPSVNSNWTEVESTVNTITIENLNTNTNYYVWLIDNANNISEKMIVEITQPAYRIDSNKYATTLAQAIGMAQDGSTIYLLKDYEDSSVATITKNITLDVQNYTLTKINTITINSSKKVEIVGTGAITSSTNNSTITNNGNLTINMDGKIENTNTSSSYRAIQHNGGTVTVNKGTVSGAYYGIYANSSSYKVIINGGTVQSTNLTNGYAINGGDVTINGGTVQGYNGISARVTMNDGEIIAQSYGINTSGQVIINGGNIKGNYGIYNNSNVEVKVLGGTVEGTTYGIYGYGNYNNKITIGDINTEVNHAIPIISGGLYGIYMRTTTNTYNFYNGIIMGTNTIPYTDTVIPRDGYMIYTYYDYNIYRKYCAVLDKGVDEITIEHNPTEWTNQSVEVQVRYPVIPNTTLQFSEDGEEWIDVNNGYTTNISENKTVYARMLDSSGIVLEKVEHEITNIDKIAPRVEISPEKTKYIIYDKESTSVDIDLNVVSQDEGGSGIKTSKYGWSTSKDNKPTQWFNLQDGTDIRETECNVGTYYLWFDIEDVAGNKCETEYVRYIVELQQAVAKIGENYYYTIQEAFDAANIGDTVEIIKDTNEEAMLQEGKNVILDLQGHSVGNLNSTESSVILVNNGILKIIDTSEGKTGIIEHLAGTAIENNGTLTIGNNDESIEDGTPTISGRKIGIKNNNTLNYYDGTIIGKTAIDGNTQDTPENYGPVSNFENGMSVINLRIISNYVARIEWFYYTTLQGAIDDCPARADNKEQSTIHILKDIVLDDGVNIDYGQNIGLDLNGYVLTSSKNSVITNYGNLEILDSSENQDGSISSSIGQRLYKVINNKKNLVFSGGKIITDKDNNYSIYNDSGIVDIKGGYIENISTTRENYGVYNAGLGKINMDGGNITVYNDTTSSYGIYNDASGIVDVNKGDIINNSKFSYVVYNDDIGTININGGNIIADASKESYGLCNNSIGTINVNGGNIRLEGSSTNYGVRNKGMGTININNITLYSECDGYNNHSYGIINLDTGIININYGDISSYTTYGTSYGIRNSGTGTINVKDGNINSRSDNSNSYGIYNSSTGIVNVNKGRIDSNTNDNRSHSYGIYNLGTGTINIGVKADGIVDNTAVIIKAKAVRSDTVYGGFGIYSNNKGICNFYDGIIQGTNKTMVKVGVIDEVEDGYVIKNDNVEGFNSIYLEKQIQKDYIIENKRTEKKYYSIKEALEEAVDGEETELKILQNFDLQESIKIEEEKNIVLDLSGKTIMNLYWKINNEGTLTIKDSIGEGKIKSQTTMTGIYNCKKGVLKVNGGEIDFSITGNDSSYNAVYYGIYNEGIAEINGGKIRYTGSYGATTFYGIYNSSTGIVNINSGNIQCSPAYGVYNTGAGIINMNGGLIASCRYGIYNSSIGTINVNDGTINNSLYGIYNSGTGTVNINDGVINIGSGFGYGINNHSTGTINVNGGEIICTASNDDGYGIYNDSTGVINIGIKGDGVVSNTKPVIKGIYTGSSNNYGGYGIKNESGELYFYDGRIEGSKLAKTDKTVMTEWEEKAELLYEDNNKVLTLTTEAMEVAKVGDISYTSLQEAINVVGNTKATIELLRGIEITKQDTTITIGENQDITLDLKGFNIISAVEDAVFTNNGKFKITDTTAQANGKISSSYSKTIQNNSGATLELEKGIIVKNKDKDNVIYNEGILNITGATITNIDDTASSEINSIYNIGNVNISAGRIQHKIVNTQNGNIIITNGTINNEISNMDNASIDMTGGTINVSNSSTVGIKNSSTNTVTIAGGTIESEKYCAIISTAGTLNIGAKDGNIVNEPIIEGKTNGIYSLGTLNIYDGTIKGEISAINGEITELENKTEIVVVKEGTKEKITLIKVDTPLAEVSGNTYYSLKEAIESISETGIVKILREGTVAQTIEIPEGKNITLDLNGNNLKMYNKLQNTGILTIEDTSESKAGNLMSYKDSPIYNSGNLTIKEGNISENSYGIYNKTGGTTNVEGGNIKENTYGIYSIGGTVNVTGGNITGNQYGTFANSGTINISGGTSASNEYGVYNSKGTMNLSGGNVNGNTHEIYNGGTGTINIISGNYVATKETLIENVGNGTIVIGTQDGNVSKDTPMLQAEKYAITNTKGTIKFYDGKIKGKVGAIQGLYLYKEDGYEVKTDYEEGYYIDTLIPSGTVTTVAKIGTVEYTNLQAAINAATSENTIITLVNSINTGVNFVVEEGQNVVIDLNGKAITSDIEGSTIENAGTLKIIDSSSTQTGKVSNTKGIAITNTGTLTLGENDGELSTTCPEISGNTIGIKNTGELNFYDGIIKASVALEGNVSQRATGYIINKTKTNGIEQLTLGK